MQENRQQVAVFNDRPFFEKALIYGVRNRIIDQEKIATILGDAPKGMVQIAEHFGTAYLRPNIEEARARIVNLVSLFLEESCGGDLGAAARSLRDHSFLSHSRGGSEMLKRLWAMPEDGSVGNPARQSQKQFLADWSLRSLTDYRHTLEQRQAYQMAIAAAFWFAERLGVPPSMQSTIETVAVESIIRSAMLVYLSGNAPVALPNVSEFAGMLGAIRKKGIPAKGRKQLKEIFEVLPEPYQVLVRGELKKLESEDLPRVFDSSRALGEVLRELEPLYFLRDFGPEDASRFDTVVASNWQKITRGKTDDHSLLTIFVCLAADTAPKPVLSRAAARALIRKVHADGFRHEPVLAFIRASAPHEMQDGLLTLWSDFFPEAESCLRDSTDTRPGDALAFLKENCIVV